MITAKIADGARISWIVKDSSGNLVSGLDPGAFTVTVVAPDMATTTTVAVAEAGVGGVYYFDIPSSFFGDNGTGVYGILIVLTNLSIPLLFYTVYRGVQVTVSDIDRTFSLGQAILGNVV